MLLATGFAHKLCQKGLDSRGRLNMAVGTKNSVIQGCGAHHIAVQTRDWEVSLRFYRDVLGMEVIAEFGSPDRKIVLLDMGDGSHMELFQPTAASPTPEDATPNDPGNTLCSRYNRRACCRGTCAGKQVEK